MIRLTVVGTTVRTVDHFVQSENEAAKILKAIEDDEDFDDGILTIVNEVSNITHASFTVTQQEINNEFAKSDNFKKMLNRYAHFGRPGKPTCSCGIKHYTETIDLKSIEEGSADTIRKFAEEFAIKSGPRLGMPAKKNQFAIKLNLGINSNGSNNRCILCAFGNLTEQYILCKNIQTGQFYAQRISKTELIELFVNAKMNELNNIYSRYSPIDEEE